MTKERGGKEGRQGSAKLKPAQSKKLPETPCIVCGSENWCDCDWDHFYGESIQEDLEPVTPEDS